MGERTKEGLPVVTEETLKEFLKKYDISSPHGEPYATEIIRQQNPEIYRMLRLGVDNAPDKTSRSYLETGMQMVYELLRLESAKQ